MTPFDPAHGAQAAYNFWLGLIPQFLGQFGGAVPGVSSGAVAGKDAAPGTGSTAPPSAAFMFPADQIAKAAALTQESLLAMARSIAPLIQASGAPGLLGHWAAAMPALAFGKPDEAAANLPASTMQAWMAPWNALMANAVAASSIATPQGSAPSPSSGAPSMFPWDAMSQPWVNMASQTTGATPAQLSAVFDRTYGALSDALGLSPVRKLQAAWQDLIAAALAQQEARTSYALLVQSAFAQGLQRLMGDLANKASSGERIDSVLALLRLWAMKTEEVVHETLQSETGLAATTALTRSSLAYRRKMQQVASIVGEALDMATRRELDEAYREIQALKREVRASRAVRANGKVGGGKPGAASR